VVTDRDAPPLDNLTRGAHRSDMRIAERLWRYSWRIALIGGSLAAIAATVAGVANMFIG